MSREYFLNYEMTDEEWKKVTDFVGDCLIKRGVFHHPNVTWGDNEVIIGDYIFNRKGMVTITGVCTNSNKFSVEFPYRYNPEEMINLIRSLKVTGHSGSLNGLGLKSDEYLDWHELNRVEATASKPDLIDGDD